jgi:hypothetical protein
MVTRKTNDHSLRAVYSEGTVEMQRKRSEPARHVENAEREAVSNGHVLNPWKGMTFGFHTQCQSCGASGALDVILSAVRERELIQQQCDRRLKKHALCLK